MKTSAFALLMLVLLSTAARGDGEATSPEAALLARVRQSPNDSVLRDQIGELYMSENAYGKAIQAFKTALSLDPSDLRGMYELGMAYESAGDTARALRIYRKARAWSAYYLNFRLGVCYEKTGDYRSAVRSFKRIEKMKENPAVHYGLAVALGGLERYGEALVELDKARVMDPGLKQARDFFPGDSDMEQTLLMWNRRNRKQKLLRLGGILLLLGAVTALILGVKTRSNRSEEPF